MKARHFLGWGSLRPESDEWAANPSLPLTGIEGAVLPRLDSPADQAHALSQEEATLVARAREGDQEAFGVLVRRHQRQVYQLAFRMLRDSEEAGEATQEAFLAAWQGLRGFRGDARFSTWMYRIAYHHCLKVTHSQRRDSAVRAALREESSRAQNPTAILSTQHAQAAEQEMRETVRAEIANLPPKYRAVLILRHLQDLSYEEMAEVMRVPIGTVKTQLFRARALLKERLEGFGLGHTEGLTGGFAQGLARAGEIGAGLRSMLERKWDNPRKGEG